ncbi:MAG: hypothetical protein E7678_03130 [Ruminococcaceae bacterium]|nr:hypothetical protein [Oscillospiraceae bacterium]
MKRTIVIFLILCMLLSTFVGCSSTNSEKSKILSKIDKFMNAIEEMDVTAYNKCLDPDIQTVNQSAVNSIGGMFGIDNAYGLSNSVSTLFNTAFLETYGIKIDCNRKKVISVDIEKSNATVYVVYTIKMESNQLTAPTEKDCTLCFTMVKKDDEWYVRNMEEVADNADPQILTAGLNIKYGTSFSDGVAFITYQGTGGETKNAAIDKTGNVLYNPTFNIHTNKGYHNGILVLDNVIYDKVGNVIASPEISGYDALISGNCNGYVLAKKVVESYNGDKIYLGVIGNDGKWKYELSDQNPIIVALKKIIVEREYDSVSDKTIDGILISIIQDNSDGDDTIEYVQISDYYGVGVYYDLEKNQIVDKPNNPEFSNNDVYYVGNYVLKKVNNGTGGVYLGLFDTSGNPAFEPIRIDTYSYDYYPVDNYGFVLKYDSAYKFYDCAGNVVEYTDVVRMEKFSEGLAFAQNSAGQYFYINHLGEKVIK